ncbi:hypothetical protein L7F22_065618 [Adiantum nelumboides]|nr:hypothetical protein [Adiantum nelumboides]
MSAPRLRDGGGGSAPPAGSTATSATIAAPAVAPAVGAAGATANASAASAPAAGGVAGKKNANTIDALTATLQSSKLADGATSGDRLATMDNDAIKTLLLDTTTEAGEGLSVCLHDHIWANGGEAVLRLGLPPRTYEEQEHFKHDIDGIEAVDRCFTEDELELAVKNVVRACQDAEGQATVLCRGQSPQSSYAYLMLRRIPAGAQELLELRIAVIGNVDAGKSSTLGVLTKGGLDDGRGKARVNLFRTQARDRERADVERRHGDHGFRQRGRGRHECRKGIDGARKKDELGGGVREERKGHFFHCEYAPVWGRTAQELKRGYLWQDLAGHERYLKTTVGGLTGCLPDFCMLMVGGNAGLIGMSKEHLGVALALAVPVLVCITKVDMTPPHILEATIKQLSKILRSPGCRKTPVFVQNQEQAVETALRLGNERICPIFQISNVTGQNLPLLRSFLNVLPQANPAKFSPEAPFKFQLQDVFSVPFVGCVVSGVILSGVVKVGDNLIIGPDTLGQFTPTSVRSIQRKRVNVDAASAGQSASFALKRIRRNQVRKGMVMLSRTDSPPKASMTCDAEILCLYHSTTLSVGSCMVLHAASIRQTVRILAIAKLDSHGDVSTDTTTASANPDKPVVRTGDRALLRLQFIRFAEYVEPGLKLITREGKTKLNGVIRSVGQTGPLGAVNKQPDSQGPTMSAPPANATATASA